MNQESPNSQLEIRGKVTPKRRWPAILVASVVLAALGLTGAGWAYANHYRDLILPNTMVGATSLGGMTAQEARETLEKSCSQLRVTFRGDAKGSAQLKDLGLECDVDKTVKQAMTANESLEGVLASTVQERRLKAAYKLDKNVLVKKVRSLTKNAPGSVVDPSIGFDTNSEGFIVTPGKPGKGIDPAAVKQAAVKTWQGQTSVTETFKIAQVNPIAVNPVLRDWATNANKLISPRVYLVGRGIGHTIKSEDKAQWIEVTDLGPKLNQSQVEAWLKTFTQANVDVNTEPGERKLTKDGKLLTMTKMAIDSRHVKNNPQIAQEITASLQEGKNYRAVFQMETREGTYNDMKTDQALPTPPYSPKSGEKWISVDLVNHTTTAWEGNQVVWGPVASVHGSVPSPTHVGIYHVQSKHPASRMKGNGWDGAYDVVSPWTMYYSGGYAIHGAPKRRQWVQTNYGGSHGCVNLKPPQAKELYDWTPLGTTVVIHKAGTI